MNLQLEKERITLEVEDLAEDLMKIPEVEKVINTYGVFEAKDYKELLNSLTNIEIGCSIVIAQTIIKKVKADCVVLSDFRHGIFHVNSIKKICKSIPSKTIMVADSQVATRWGNITDFKKFDIIFPNEREARFCLGDQDSNISSLCRRLLKESKCKNLILKLGEKGLYGVSGNNAKYSFVLPAISKSIKDPVGAGDSLLAYTTLSFLAGCTLAESSIMGSLAAGAACEYDGNKPISKKVMLQKIIQLNKLINFA